MSTKNVRYTSRLFRSLSALAPKPFGTRSKGLSFVLRKASEQTPATIPSEAVLGSFPLK